MNPVPVTDTDVLVVGGGINGAGIARDAAGRGLRVVLCEQHDLARHTSSASTKLIHGGLRYVEQYEFMLVRKALMERELLLNAAPHIIWPLRFVMPHDEHLRPALMIRAGLFLYDHLAPRRRLAGSRGIKLRQHPAGAPLQARFTQGFEYSDAWVDDARLVVLNAMDAAERGATILTRARFTGARRTEDGWLAQVERNGGGAPLRIRARALVNAAGPWVAEVLDLVSEDPSHARRNVRLVKGSHIIVPRMFEHDYAYIFQNPDRRIIFAIPYEREFTLIGTTDLEYPGDAAAVKIDDGEKRYLCDMASRYFRRSVQPADIVACYSGVRPLLDDESSDPASVTRDYSLEIDDSATPLMSVFGGKITTFRRLAEEAVDQLAKVLRASGTRWTATAPLPGGDMPGADFPAFLASLRQRLPWLPAPLALRYARAYGTRVSRMLDGCGSIADLGDCIAPGLYAAEVDYLRRHEYALDSRDILWRRSKLALHLPPGSAATLDDWLASHPT